MTPLKFKLIPIQECLSYIFGSSNINKIDLTPFSRGDNLLNPDIFCKNQRSQKQNYTRFDLFDQVDSNPDIYVSCLYLEILEHMGIGNIIPNYIKILCDIYSDKSVIFHWNHDNDFSKYHEKIKHIKNFKIINFGYNSIQHEYDIVVPFWSMNVTPIQENKQYFCSFVGSINNNYRTYLKKQIESTQEFKYFPAGKPENEYLKYLSSSIFSLCPLGGPNDGGFSYRFFECFHVNTVPVLLVDKLIFPYKNLNWKEICIHLPQASIDNMEALKTKLLSFDYINILNNIQKIKNKFTLGAVQEEVKNFIL